MKHLVINGHLTGSTSTEGAAAVVEPGGDGSTPATGGYNHQMLK